MRPVEDFCTLFDKTFLPQGIVLFQSLRKQLPNARLWILALDRETLEYFRSLRASEIVAISLEELETPELRAVRQRRSQREYCWTLTPFLPAFLLEKYSLSRVTYLDADLYFFRSPQLLIDELVESGKKVLITEHGFAPEYSRAVKYGRFCVQFVTFVQSLGAFEILKRWQAQCLDWCKEYEEDGKFGDQKYLDEWPVAFADLVHIFSRPELTLGPWNVAWRSKDIDFGTPVFYHFHGFRLYSEFTQLWRGYQVSNGARKLYLAYLSELKGVLVKLRSQESLREFSFIGRRYTLSKGLIQCGFCLVSDLLHLLLRRGGFAYPL